MKRIEGVLILTVVVGLFAIIGSQALHSFNPVDFYAGIAEKLEGEPVNFYDEFPETRVTSGQYHSVFATVTVQVENFSSLEKAVLVVNGEEVADFREKQVTIKVAPGDILAVDGSFYTHEIVFRVVAASQNVSQPEIGQTVKVEGDVVILCEVRLK